MSACKMMTTQTVPDNVDINNEDEKDVGDHKFQFILQTNKYIKLFHMVSSPTAKQKVSKKKSHKLQPQQPKSYSVEGVEHTLERSDEELNIERDIMLCAFNILDTFVVNGSVQEVDILYEEKVKIKTAVERGEFSSALFDNAREQVYELIQ
eukprot:Pgem_evm1s11282